MYGTQQFTGQQTRPQQYTYGTVGPYRPAMDFTGIFESMMPMIIMIIILALILPLMKGIIKE